MTNPANGDDFAPAWAPGGGALAFQRVTYDDAGFASSSIRILRAGHSMAITEGSEPAWSVRNLIAFTRYQGPERRPTIYIVKPDGSSLRRVVAGAEPNWSPDGRQLVFTAARFPGDIAKISAGGRGFRRLTRTGSEERAPVFSPDGRRIAYVRGSPPFEDLRVAPAPGGPSRHVISPDAVQVDGEGFSGIDWRPLLRPGFCN
jgi:Tol biopolymer transport system component